VRHASPRPWALTSAWAGSAIAAGTGYLVSRVPGSAFSLGVAVDTSTDTVYVTISATAAAPGRIDIIDEATNTLTASIAVPGGTSHAGIAANSSTDTIFVTLPGGKPGAGREAPAIR
jgi:DNA-binding beta-propeller fold protein YncE